MDEDAYQAYRSVIVSPTLRSIWAEVYGERFWSDLDLPWTQATIEDVRFVGADRARTRRHGSSTSAAVPAASFASRDRDQRVALAELAQQRVSTASSATKA